MSERDELQAIERLLDQHDATGRVYHPGGPLGPVAERVYTALSAERDEPERVLPPSEAG